MTPTPKELAKEIIINIFALQHKDNSAKLICLSTPEIADYLVDQILKVIPSNVVYRVGKKYINAVDYYNQVKTEIKKF